MRLPRPPKKGSLICQNIPLCRGMESLEDIQKCVNLHFLNFSFYVGRGGTNNKLVNHVVKFKEKCFGKVFQSSVRHFVFVPSVSTRLLPSTVCQQEEDWKILLVLLSQVTMAECFCCFPSSGSMRSDPLLS